jgi:hypothetical protein
MWGMLGFGGRGMTQGEKCLGDIARHGDVKVTGLVVPVNLKPRQLEPDQSLVSAYLVAGAAKR